MKKTYLLDTLIDNEVTNTIVLKNKREWRLDIEQKYDEVVDAFRNEKLYNFEVNNIKPFFKIAFRRWSKNQNRYVEYAYLWRFE